MQIHLVGATSISDTNDYRYLWPNGLSERWKKLPAEHACEMPMPESASDIACDSRWPAFFPSPIAFITAAHGPTVAMERIVGPVIVNRFPYVVAISICRKALSERHHPRLRFMETLECGGAAAIQFLPPGRTLAVAAGAVATIPEDESGQRISATGLPTRQAITSECPVMSDAYMVYETRLARPGESLTGQPIYDRPYVDVGSHRVYFLEVTAIQLRQDIACGRSQVHWHALPEWTPQRPIFPQTQCDVQSYLAGRYIKPYTPCYDFPSRGTVGFESDYVDHGIAVKQLPLWNHSDQIEIDNDRARWPCFFPSSLGMITSWTDSGIPNFMPCGSTAVVSRQPMTIATCIANVAINERYSPRASLELIRKRRRFGCGVAFVHKLVVNAIRYGGNVSIASDPDKVSHSGLHIQASECASPVLEALPIHYDCMVVGEVPLGTHVMILGEVNRIRLRDDVVPENPLEWYPLAQVDAPK